MITSLRNFHGLSPWHRPCPVLTSCGDLQHHSGHRQDDWNCGVFAISDNIKFILGLCNMNECWRWYRSHTLACFGRNFVCYVTYLPISPQGMPRLELSYRVYLQQPVEFKIVRTENSYVPNSAVELAQRSYRFQRCQASRHRCCRGACQILQRLEKSKSESRGFKTSRDLTSRRPPA